MTEANETNREMPNFLVIGAAKSGTKSLHRYLGQHPEISMSISKEPTYFLRHEERDVHRFQVRDRDEYLALFEPGFSLRGEASVRYTWWPVHDGVPAAIAAEVPDMKFVYLVRDPMDRVVSQYVQMRSNREIDSRRSFRSRSLSETLRDPEPALSPLIAPSLYMTQIRQYLEFFPRESILVVDNDALRNERARTVAEVLDFLGAGPMPPGADLETEHNRFEEKREEANAYIRLTESGLLRELLDRVPDPLRDRAVKVARRRFSRKIPRPQLEPADRAWLEEIFRPEVQELREFTGRPFRNWGI